MSIKRDRIKLKTYFETGDRPTEEEFSDLVESGINQNDDEVFVDHTDPSNPKVGIGTDQPEEKLHVDGSVEINQNLQVKGSLFGKDSNWGRFNIHASKLGASGGSYFHMNGSNVKVDDGKGNKVDDKNQGGITFVAAGNGVLNGFSFVHYNHNYSADANVHSGNPKQWANSMRITGEGNVGIGTELPDARLHLKSNNTIDTGLKLTGQSGIQNGDILSTDGSGSVKWVPKTDVTSGLWVDDGNGNIRNGNPGTVKVKTNAFLVQSVNNDAHTWIPFSDGEVYLTGNKDVGSNTGDIHFRSYDSTQQHPYDQHMVVKGNGKVGIDNYDPKAKLDIIGKAENENGHGILKLAGADTGKDLRLGVMHSDNGNLPYTWIQSHGAIALKINPHPAGNTTTINEGAGNVGIGIELPTEKLHVKGNVKVHGGISGVDDWNKLNIGSGEGTNIGAYLSLRTPDFVGPNQGGMVFVTKRGADRTNGFEFIQHNAGEPSEWPRCFSIDGEKDSYFWNNKIYFRGDRDQNHGLGHFGDTNANFADLNIDGPVLFGYGGGALGVRRGITEEIALRWNENGNVGVGVADPIRDLQVNGRTFIGNSLNVGPQKANLLELNAEGRAGMAIITSANDVLNFHDDTIDVTSRNIKPYTIRAHDDRGIRFYSDHETMRITSEGKVGIGIGETNPNYLLHLGSHFDAVDKAYHLINGDGDVKVKWWPTSGSALQSIYISMYAHGRVLAPEFNAFSDARIKSIKGLSNNENDLKTLSQIEITDYTHKDTIANGNKTVKKVIGQQLYEVFPQAVSLNKDVVPDIYENALVNAGWVELKTDLKVGDKVRLILEKSQELFEVAEVEENRFKTVKEVTEENVFVYGRQVNDFHVVDYDAIAMLNVSATQELAKRVESQQQEIDELKAMVKALMSKIPQ